MATEGVRGDRRGVSSVVAVLLMVAITVILASVVAVFVLDIGGNATQTSPQMGWEYDYNGGNVEATLVSGDAVDVEYLSVKGSACSHSLTGSGTVDAGTTLQIGNGCPTSGVSITVVWDSPEDDTTAIVGEFSN
jgi:flagellin-like protein